MLRYGSFKDMKIIHRLISWGESGQCLDVVAKL